MKTILRATPCVSAVFSDVADLGVLSTDSDRVVDQMIDATKMSLFGRYSIIGRSVIVSKCISLMGWSDG